MATARSLDDKLKDLDREISELQSARKVVHDTMRPFYNELERIEERVRQCVNERDRLRDDKERQQRTVQRVMELEAELRLAQSENARLSDKNRQFKQSIDKATKYSKTQRNKINDLEGSLTAAQSKLSSHEAKYPAQARCASFNNTVTELQEQLDHTTKLLNKTKEQFTNAEQVTAATRQRELQKSDISEALQQEMTSQLEPTAHAGTCTIIAS